jgi:hypothetical protein
MAQLVLASWHIKIQNLTKNLIPDLDIFGMAQPSSHLVKLTFQVPSSERLTYEAKYRIGWPFRVGFFFEILKKTIETMVCRKPLFKYFWSEKNL